MFRYFSVTVPRDRLSWLAVSFSAFDRHFVVYHIPSYRLGRRE